MAVNNDTSCLDLISDYDYPGTGGCSLDTLLEIIIGKLTDEHFTQKTIFRQKKVLNRLRKCADSLGVDEYTSQLRQRFLADNQYQLNKVGTGFNKSRYEQHRKVIQWIDSYIATGEVDYSPIRKKAVFLHSTKPLFIDAYNTYLSFISYLSQSTKDLYCVLVGYFLDFLDETKGYYSLENLQKGDVDDFIRHVVKYHFPNSLSSVISGLRAFLEIETFSIAPSLRYELPFNLKKHHYILKPLSTDEVDQVNGFLDSRSDKVSFRDRAITEIALGTGSRSIDILHLKFSNLDLENDRLYFVQQKTGKALVYPLTASIGNSIVNYILHERPESKSPYIFLTSHAPYVPLQSHSACRLIIKRILANAEIELADKEVGSRLTRHSRATYLLNSGVPLPIIAQSIGHRRMHTVQVYLSADETHMAECILPVPVRKVVKHE